MAIEIREHVESDWASYWEWQSVPAMAAFVAWLPRTREESEAGLRDAIAQQRAVPRVRYFFAVVDADLKEVVGEVGFTVVREGVGDCGWFILKRFWGRGYATRAARLMIAYAFGHAGLQRLEASCVIQNVGSRRVMEKCGFRCVAQDGVRTRYALSKDGAA